MKLYFSTLIYIKTECEVHAAAYFVDITAFFAGFKPLGHEVDHSLPSSDKVMDEWSCISTPHTPSCCAKGNFTSLLFQPFLCMRMKLECQLLIRTKTAKDMQ